MKKQKKLIVAIIIFSMMAMYGSVPLARAASLTLTKDVLSDSDLSAVATHTITFTTGIALVNTDKITFTFESNFSDPVQANVTCPAGNFGAATVAGKVATCPVTGAVATGTKTLIVTGVTNPATAGSKLMLLRTKTTADVVIEQADINVAVIDDVTMTATVSATLAFSIAGTSTGAVINGVAITATSTATTTPFGILTVGATSTVGQDLTVTTNADNGYVVTVEQNQELTNTTGSNINSFKNAANGTGTVVPEAWVDPTSILDSFETYGHMGLTMNDDATYGNANFTSSKFAGLSGTSTMQIMSHNGPADGSTIQKGKASVLYAVKISALQEAGDYTNTLTYICTPTY